MKKLINIFLSLSLVFLGLNSCAPGGSNAINLFSLNDDIQLGKQMEQQIASSNEYRVLDQNQYPEAYGHLQRITDNILNSGQVTHKDEFEWKVHIVQDDNTLNAFVTPGGYIYVYTGLIKYLDTEDQLAGVMGHEIAHADRRHSTTNMSKQYGVQALLGMAVGNNSGQLAQVIGGVSGQLLGLKFSRGAEADADKYSVIYLAKTRYQCNGAAGFFQKILEQGNSQAPPQFLSTHPSSANRVQDINAMASEVGCSVKPSGNNYKAFQNSLP